MKGGMSPLGYTIIEVMIVLAVSAVMFLIAASFINGKQARTAFTTGVNQLASNIQDVIEQVTDGQYSDIPLTCNFDGLTTSLGGPDADNNDSCVYLGKILHFDESGQGSTPAAQQYEILSLAGGRATVCPPTNSTCVSTTIVTPSAADAVVVDSLTIQQMVPQSLSVQNVTVNGSSTVSFAIGFLQGQGALDADNNLVSGTQNVSLYYANAADLQSSADHDTAEQDINGSSLQQAQSADICVTDGTRYADITLGTDAGQLSVNVDMHGTAKPSEGACSS